MAKPTKNRWIILAILLFVFWTGISIVINHELLLSAVISGLLFAVITSVLMVFFLYLWSRATHRQ